MAPIPTTFWDHMRSHHGVANSAALRRLKISKARREQLLRDGVVEVVHEGVYRLRAWPNTFESRCAALCAADPSLVVCCGSAGRLQGSRLCTDDVIHVLTDRTTVPVLVDRSKVVVHRTTILPRAHVVRRADGIRLTKSARTLIDDARHRDVLTLESLIEDAISHGRCTAQTLRAMANELSGRGRRGTARFNEVLRGRPAWRRSADSHPEVRLHRALCDAGLHLELQPELHLPDGRTIHPDLGDHDATFYVEIDDHEWHGGRQRTTRDNRRDRQAGLGGAQVVRVGTDEIEERLDAVVDDIVRLHALRARAAAPPDAA